MKSAFPFPNEILLEIITQSAPYLSVFNSALSLGPNSPWSQVLRQRKSMALVCKKWNALSTPLLYRDVALRRTEQLIFLEETLSNTTNGVHVHELTITEACRILEYGYEGNFYSQAYVPKFPDGDLSESEDLTEEAREQLDRFLSTGEILSMLPYKCPNLRRFDVRTFIPNYIARNIAADPALSHIVHFGFGGSVDDVDNGYARPWFYAAAERMCSLSNPSLCDFTFIPRHFRTQNDPPPGAPLEAVVFPELEELTITYCIQEFPKHWTLPQLKSLSLCHANEDRSLGPSFLEDLCYFLREHGQNLQNLAIYLKVRSLGTLPANVILRECPNVNHFICDGLPPIPESGAPAEVFPKVTTLDVYSFDESWEDVKDHFPERVACFPSLKSVKFFEEPRLFENFFRPPASFDIDPMDVFEEACFWIAPQVRLNRHVLRPPNCTGGIDVVIASLPLHAAAKRGQRQPDADAGHSSGEFESHHASAASVSDHDSDSDALYWPSSSSSETDSMSDEDADGLDGDL